MRQLLQTVSAGGLQPQTVRCQKGSMHAQWYERGSVNNKESLVVCSHGCWCLSGWPEKLRNSAHRSNGSGHDMPNALQTHCMHNPTLTQSMQHITLLACYLWQQHDCAIGSSAHAAIRVALPVRCRSSAATPSAPSAAHQCLCTPAGS